MSVYYNTDTHAFTCTVKIIVCVVNSTVSNYILFFTYRQYST